MTQQRNICSSGEDKKQWVGCFNRGTFLRIYQTFCLIFEETTQNTKKNCRQVRKLSKVSCLYWPSKTKRISFMLLLSWIHYVTFPPALYIKQFKVKMIINLLKKLQKVCFNSSQIYSLLQKLNTSLRQFSRNTGDWM